MSQTEREILEISHLAIHKTYFNAPSRANGEISQNAMTLIANYIYVIRVDLNDDRAGMEISIIAHKLPIEKVCILIRNRCHFGNFANVPTTGCIKLK